MLYRKSLFVWICTLSACVPVQAREYFTLPNSHSAQLEQDLAEQEISFAEFEHLQQWLEEPLDINRATLEELLDLPHVEYPLAQQMITQRMLRGGFHSLADAQSKIGISDSEWEDIKPYITVRPLIQSMITESSTDPGFQSKRFIAQSVSRSGYGRQIGDDDDVGLQSSLEWRANWTSGIQQNALFSHRERTRVQTESGSVHLQSDGPENQLDIERFSIFTSQKQENTWVAGHYNIGFGTGLSFDNTGSQYPNGWKIQSPVNKQHETGKLRVKRALFGAAGNKNFPMGAKTLRLDLFSSHDSYDLYQYDMRYGPDDIFISNHGKCTGESGPERNFKCGIDGRWYSSYVVDKSNNLENFNRVTLQDAYTESLLGTHVQWRANAHRFGLVNYFAQVDFNINMPDIRFAPSARYPERHRLSSFGSYYQFFGEKNLLSAEISASNDNGMAVYSRLFQPFTEHWMITSSMRYYNHHYNNPYTSGEAARDETLGLAQRNEQGIRFILHNKHAKLKSTTTLDTWQQTYKLVDGIQWQKLDRPITNLYLQQKLTLALRLKESIQLLLQVTDKDIAISGRGQNYQNGDELGKGERRKVKIKYSNRLHRITFSMDYSHVWEDVTKYKNKFEQEGRWNALLDFQINNQWMLSTLVGHWIHEIEDPSIDHDRANPAWTYYLFISRKMNKGLSAEGRLGKLQYHDERIDEYDKYMTLYFSISYKF